MADMNENELEFVLDYDAFQNNEFPRNNNRLNDFPLYNHINNLFDGFTYDTADVLTEDLEVQIGTNEYRRIENKLIENKLSIKTLFSCIRLSLLYGCYEMEKRKISSYLLSNLIFFLLIHESLVISNFIAMKGYFLLQFIVFNRNNNNRVSKFPTIIIIIDVITNFIFFIWFLYGCFSIMCLPDIIEFTLEKNPLLMYLITIIILCGFFIYSRLMFLLILIVCFYPVITYYLIKNYIARYNLLLSKFKVQKELIEITYEQFLLNNIDKKDVDICIICTENFESKDKIVQLKCNTSHIFHFDCIRQWINKKPICPICRYDLSQ
jgi:hypothetical protein